MTLSTEAFLESYKPEVRDLALRIRDVVREVLHDTSETVNPAYKTIIYGAGPHMSDEICYIAPLTTSVNLGFPFGTKLPDPEGLLKGTGKLMRHIKFEGDADVDTPAIRAILTAAKTHGSF